MECGIMIGIKGTNGRQKTYEIFHVYCFFHSGFMCRTTVIFGITVRWKSCIKCYCLRKPGDMAKSRNMKVVQIYSFLVW